VNEKDRIAKVVARRSKFSRRDVERILLTGEVIVDGEVIKNPAVKIPYNSNIEVNKIIIPHLEPTRLWLFNKPVDVLCAKKDKSDKKIVFDYIPRKIKSPKLVGRLDYKSEGLLLVTNDGEFARELEGKNYDRTYEVRVFGNINAILNYDFTKPICIGGIRYSVKKFSVLEKGVNSWLEFTLNEGKNREIRNILSYFDLKISRLVRTKYGKYSLIEIKESNFKEVKIK